MLFLPRRYSIVHQVPNPEELQAACAQEIFIDVRPTGGFSHFLNEFADNFANPHQRIPVALHA